MLRVYDHELRHQFRRTRTARRRRLDLTGGQVTKYTESSSNFGADGTFFHIIREGLQGLADGEDYFDLLADDVVFEYIISVPGYPKRVEGRQNIIDLYGDYDSFLTVRSADNLRVYRDLEASVVVLEYEVHGESVQTGRPYDNRFVSIVTIKDGKVTWWRDYLDPVAVFDASGWPGERS
jgi:ketosteroid isomerase-like protein